MPESIPDEYLQAWMSCGLPSPYGKEFEGDAGEHFRYNVFRDWVRANMPECTRLGSVLDLVRLEPDPSLQLSFYVVLIENATIERLQQIRSVESQAHYVDVELALRALDSPATDGELMRIAAVSDRKVQLKLVKRKLPVEVATYLAENGVTKAVRNRAINQLSGRD